MAETDHSFFDNFSDHLQSTVGQQAQGLSQLKIENAKMNSNKNLSGETKAVANVLDAVDAGVQAFGLPKSYPLSRPHQKHLMLKTLTTLQRQSNKP